MDNENIEPFIFGDEVDLHHFSPKDTKIVVLEFIKDALSNNRSVIKIVHGKGISQKKMQVQKILSSHTNVESFSDDGANWGATIVHLKK